MTKTKENKLNLKELSNITQNNKIKHSQTFLAKVNKILSRKLNFR